MELNLEAISAFLENNRLADGEKLIEFNGHEISFKPTGSDSIGGEFLGLRSEEQQNVNNRTRDKFLKFVLKLFNATDASKLPAGVRKAMELNDYCGIFGRVRSLTAKGGSSTGKPLSLRRIRVVAQAVRDCRKHAVSQIDQAIARLQAKGFSPETIRGLGPISHAAVMDWTSKSVAALKAVRDAIANGSPQGEINEAIERLYALASNQKQVAKQRRESARQKEERWELDEADQYDMQADFAKSVSGILEDQLKELAGLYNVSTSKTVPKNVVRDAGKHAMKRNMHGSYCTAVMVLNRFRYSGRIGDGLAGQFEFGSKMKAESVRGKKDLLLGMLKKIIGLEEDPVLTATKRLFNAQEANRQTVLAEADFEKNDVKPLRISDNQVPMPEYTEKAQDKEEVGKRLEAQFANQLLLALKVDDVESLCRLPPNELQSKIRNEMDAETLVKFCGVVANFDTPEFREGKRVVSDYVFGELSAHLKDVDLAKAVQFMKDKYPGNNSDKIPNARLVLNVISRFIPKEGEENVEYRNRIKAIGTEL